MNTLHKIEDIWEVDSKYSDWIEQDFEEVLAQFVSFLGKYARFEELYGA